jgi:GTP cyclohydrolase IA
MRENGTTKVDAAKRERAMDAVRELISYLGDDPERDELRDTPRRVVDFYDELRTGPDPFTATTFPSHGFGDLVVVRDIPLFSLCEHHMLPWFGRATVGYIPNGRLLGLSKLPRIVYEIQSHLTTQESVTHQVAEAVTAATHSDAVAVTTIAVHSCVTVRGAKAHGSSTVASAMFGQFRTNMALRSEFLQLIGPTGGLMP